MREFALMIGVSVATLRNWEQGRRTPDGPALALLRVAAKNPVVVANALHGSRARLNEGVAAGGARIAPRLSVYIVRLPQDETNDGGNA